MHFKKENIGTLLLLVSVSVSAEVTIDGSLGGVAFDDVSPGNGFTYDIQETYGQTAGSNLFHSFDKFNIGVGEHANFSGSETIANIIARVTGGESSIAGRITSDIDGSSLFLINAAGFIFSNGAVVDVDGVFTVSTADYFEFSDDARFYSNLSETSTLSTTEISSFGFLNGSNGVIAIDSSRAVSGEDRSANDNFHVNSESILIRDADLQASEINVRMGDAAFGEIGIYDSIIESVEGGIFFQGGNIYSVESVITATGRNSEVDVIATSITLEGGNNDSVIQSGNLTSSGGSIDLKAQTITLENNAKLISSSGGGRDGGDITLTGTTVQIENHSLIELDAGVNTAAGDLMITTKNITIEDSSSLNTSSRFLGASAGDIDIKASGDFRIENDSRILAESDSTGAGGIVKVSADSIVISDSAEININALGQGNSDFVVLQSETNITIDQGSSISASSAGGGNSGLVKILGQDILLDDMSIQASANGEGTGGDIRIEANTVQITNGTAINVSSFSTAENAGNAGFVEITGDNITLDDNALFELASFGGGVGGEMRVIGSTINVDGVQIEAEAKGSGIGGDVEFTADLLNLSNTSIDASVRGDGVGGLIRLTGGDIDLADTIINITALGSGTAGDFVATGKSFTMTGSATSYGIFGDTRGDGSGADVLLSTDTVSLDGVAITSGTFGNGEGGIIEIDALSSITLNDVLLASESEGAGVGGDIDFLTSNLTISGNTNINVSSMGQGDAGRIKIIPVKDSALTIAVSDTSKFALSATGDGMAGEFIAIANDVRFSDSSGIQASVQGNAKGDLVSFETTNLIIEDDATITSDTRGTGLGGVIDISTATLVLSDAASLNAEALGSGDGGLVNIDATTVIIDGGTINTSSLPQRSGEPATGTAGILNITTTDLTLSNGAELRSDSLSEGHGGDITIDATTITLSGRNTSITAQSVDSGDGGALEIDATAVYLSDGASIKSDTLSSGAGGFIEINSTDSLSVDGALTRISAQAGGSGVGGEILINTDSVSLTNQASLQAEAFSSGEGGLISINAAELLVDNATINTNSESSEGQPPATGNSGSLIIKATDVALGNGAELRSDSLSVGHGGDIIIETGNLSLSGTDTSITAQAAGTGDGGAISVDALDVALTDNASIKSDSLQSGEGGFITVNGLNTVSVTGKGTRISAQAGGSGIGGEIRITTKDFSLTDEASLVAEAFSSGEGGLILVDATKVLIDNATVNTNSLAAPDKPPATGNSGSLSIHATEVRLDNGAQLRSDSLSEGHGGDISIETELLSANGQNTSITAQSTGSGDGGSIHVDAVDVLLTDSASIKSDSLLSGEGGFVSINGSNSVSVDGAGTSISAKAGGSGVGGAILINADSFSLTDNASLDAEAFSSGDGGLIRIEAPTVLVDRSVINTNSQATPGKGPATGSAGALGIIATDITLINDAELRSDTLSEGLGGDIRIEATTFIMSGQGTAITAQTAGTEDGGFIEINATSLALADSASIKSDSLGLGDGGEIDINVDTVTLAGNSTSITAQAAGSGDGGFIHVDAADVLLTDSASIKSDSLLSGEGGFVSINGSNSVSVDGAGTSISAKAGGSGVGGAILINADSFSLTDNASLDAEAFSSGDGGLIRIEAPTVLVDRSVINTNSQATPGKGPATGSAGALGIIATDITLINDAELRSDTLSEGLGGDIRIEATTFIMSGQGTAITAQTAGTEDGGFIEINATSLALADSASIKSDSLGLGDGGEIDINVDTVTLAGNSTSITAQAAGSGDGGAIYVTSNYFALTNEASLNAEALSSGDGGLVSISSPTVSLDGAFINTNSQTRPQNPITTGTSGTVDIVAEVITLSNGASIRSDAFSVGDGGDVYLEADEISLSGVRTSPEGRTISTSITAETFGAGEGGTIRLLSPVIMLSDKALINVSALAGSGHAGTLEVLVDNLTLDDAMIFGSTEGSGDGGSILVNDPNTLANPNTGTSIQINNGSAISVSAFTDARPGSIVLDATDILITDASRVESDTRGALRATRDDGIRIDGERLELLNSSIISSSSTGTADAGNISITLGDRLDIVGSSVNTTSALAGGGTIFIDTKDTIFIDNGIVSATASGEILESGGGDVFIDPRIFTIRQSQIVAQANAGNGGNIDLIATNFVVDTETLISASSNKGIDGTVQIESPNQSVNPSSMLLKTGFQDLPEFVRSNCDNPSENDRSYLVVENLNPVRRDPNDFLPIVKKAAVNVAASVFLQDLPPIVWRRGC